MHKNFLITICLLSFQTIYTETDFFKNREKVATIPTTVAYKKILEQSKNKALPTNSSNNLSLENILLMAEKALSRGDTKSALICYKKVLEYDPIHFNACFNLGNIYYNKGKPEKALYYYQQGIKNKREAPQYYYNIGLCLKQLKKFDKAIEIFNKAIELKSNYLKAYYQLGKTLQDKGDHQRAIGILSRALEINPDDALSHHLLGKSYKHVEQRDAAVNHLRIAYSLKPKDIITMQELANTLTMYGHLDEALGIYQKILILHPEATTAFYNIAYVLKRQGYISEAIEILKTVIDKDPEHIQAHLSLGLCYLSLGNFEDGWQEYEWRWGSTKGKIPKLYPQPIWDGSDLTGKTILIIAEQGLGDTFQFIRYAKTLKSMGAHVIFKSRPELVEILSLCDYIDEIITNTSKLPNFDVHIPLMSIPLVLKTREETIPAEIPYLKADPKLANYWRNKLAKDNNFKIGICWQGNANYSTQFLRATVAAKSVNIKLFEPLAKIPGVSLYSLQKIFGTEQLEELDEAIKIHDFGPDFDNINGHFMDTAAVIKNLDLIITVDTSISHLAAALGAPTWIILPKPADWRWMLNRTNTPWYPNVRLFRQQRPGDWSSVIQNIIQALSSLISSKPSIYSQENSLNQKESILEGLADLEQRHNQTCQSKNIEEPNKIASLPLDEFLDQMTLTALTTNKQNNADAQQFLQLYNQYLTKFPQLKEYSQQILHANRYLLELQKQIQELKENIFDPSFLDITRQISLITKYKKEIKKRIKKLEKA